MSRFNRDLYHYGSMREYKHRETLKQADWPDNSKLHIGDCLVFVACAILAISYIIYLIK